MITTINNKHKKLNVPNLRFKEFQGEWRRSKFKKVITLQRGSSPRPIIKYITTSTDGVNWIKIGDMPHFGRIVTSTEEKITREGAKKSRLVKKGDLILSNSMSYGLPYIMGIDGYIHDGWFVLKDFEDTFDKDYLCNLLISSAIQNQYKRLAAGGVVQNISSDLVNSVSVSIPLMEEQKKISSLLNLIDDRIATQNKIIEDLKKLKSAIIEKHYGQAEKLIADVADLGESFSVGNLAKEDLAETGIPCVIYGELFTTYGETILQIESHTNKTESMVLSKKGDLLFPSSTTVDAMSLIAPSVINVDGVILGGDMFGIHINHNYNAQYLSYYFNHIAKKQLAKYAKGSTIIHLHYADIKKAKLLLPSLEEQNRMAKCLVILDDKIKVENSLLNLLNSQKAYLLCQMFI